jgi:hypothetical protein
MRSSDFMSFGLPGRQDPRRFIVPLSIDNNENHTSPRHPDDPIPLLVRIWIILDDGPIVVEDLDRILERHMMLAQVDRGLDGTPFEAAPAHVMRASPFGAMSKGSASTAPLNRIIMHIKTIIVQIIIQIKTQKA